MLIRYDKIQVGDRFMVDKKEVSVTAVYQYQNNWNNTIVRLTMSDMSVHYGWDYRELTKIDLTPTIKSV